MRVADRVEDAEGPLVGAIVEEDAAAEVIVEVGVCASTIKKQTNKRNKVKRYIVDFGFEQTCGNDRRCASKHHEKGRRSITYKLNYNGEHNANEFEKW